MKKIIISAKSENNVIGRENGIPWKMDCDVEFLEETVANNTIIFGRKTFESMEAPYDGAQYIIITRKKDYKTTLPSHIVSSISEAYNCAAELGLKEVYILGGGEIFKRTINEVDTLLITEVKAIIEGDTYFPEIDMSIWKEVAREEHPADAHNEYPYAFVEYAKR